MYSATAKNQSTIPRLHYVLHAYNSVHLYMRVPYRENAIIEITYSNSCHFASNILLIK